MDLHGLLVVDKPAGLTSHDVVARLRRLLQTRKIGHAGTLDPAAEGVLVVAIGRATKLLTGLSSSNKSYAAHVVLGAGSESGDIEGPVILRSDENAEPTEHDVWRVISQFAGDISQVPPAHSAVKVGGNRLYRSARRGDLVEVPARLVRIDAIEVLAYRFPDLYLLVDCTAGTYIRALARDIGDALGMPAYLHYLLRTRSGPFALKDAWPLDVLERELSPATFARYGLHPTFDEGNDGALVLNPDDTNAWYDGRPMQTVIFGERLATVQAFRPDGWWIGSGIFEPGGAVYQPKLVVHQ